MGPPHSSRDLVLLQIKARSSLTARSSGRRGFLSMVCSPVGSSAVLAVLRGEGGLGGGGRRDATSSLRATTKQSNLSRRR